MPPPDPRGRARVVPNPRARAPGLLLREVGARTQAEPVVGGSPRVDHRQREKLRRAGFDGTDLEPFASFRVEDQEANARAGEVFDVRHVKRELLPGRHVAEAAREEVGFDGAAHGGGHVVGEDELEVFAVAHLKEKESTSPYGPFYQRFPVAKHVFLSTLFGLGSFPAFEYHLSSRVNSL